MQILFIYKGDEVNLKFDKDESIKSAILRILEYYSHIDIYKYVYLWYDDRIIKIDETPIFKILRKNDEGQHVLFLADKRETDEGYKIKDNTL